MAETFSSKEREHTGKEIFIAGYDGDVEVGELAMFDSISDLNDYLSNMSPVSETNLTIIHGILTSAEYIPENIGHGVYVIAVDPEDDVNGCIYEFTSKDPDALASLIEETLSAHHNELGDLSIDNVFILYGYEMSTCYAVNEEEVDEAELENCQKIVDVVNEMKERVLSIEK